ncbi:MAG: thiamine diphosphokinase [Lachnospiraceae bacterium]|nr:thiamine diphosphokinase [Lachnospiraceae bacterium]
MGTQTGKCIIVAAGDLTVSKIEVSREDLLIAVDGGLDYCGLLGLEPDLVLGDFDSAGETQLAQVALWEEQSPERVIRLKPEKDDTDTLAAIRVALERGYTSFLLYGATGGRLEHTIANIQCLLFLKHHGAVGYLMDGLGMCFVMEDEEVRFRASMEGYLSLFSLGGKALGVNIRGMKYELEDAEITNDFPVGISNEFIGQEAAVSVRQGQLLGIVTY